MRYDQNLGGKGTHFQMAHIMAKLPGYQHVYIPAMNYFNPQASETNAVSKASVGTPLDFVYSISSAPPHVRPVGAGAWYARIRMGCVRNAHSPGWGGCTVTCGHANETGLAVAHGSHTLPRCMGCTDCFDARLFSRGGPN